MTPATAYDHNAGSVAGPVKFSTQMRSLSLSFSFVPPLARSLPAAAGGRTDGSHHYENVVRGSQVEGVGRLPH